MVCGLLVGSRNVGAQAPASRADSETMEAIERVVARANSDGLPGDAVRAKALEGLSRGVSGDTVVRVVVAFADALREARSVLGDKSPSREDLLATAGILTAGVSRAAAAGLAAAAHARPGAHTVTVAFVVTGDLVARGVPPDSAAVAVTAEIRRGASDAQLWRLREAIAQDIRTGRPRSTLPCCGRVSPQPVPAGTHLPARSARRSPRRHSVRRDSFTADRAGIRAVRAAAQAPPAVGTLQARGATDSVRSIWIRSGQLLWAGCRDAWSRQTMTASSVTLVVPVASSLRWLVNVSTPHQARDVGGGGALQLEVGAH